MVMYLHSAAIVLRGAALKMICTYQAVGKAHFADSLIFVLATTDGCGKHKKVSLSNV